MRELPPVFAVGRQLMYASENTGSGSRLSKAHVLENIGITTRYAIKLRSASSSQCRDQFIFDNGNKFSIDSFTGPIEFEIGDKVVVANWDDPVDMLTVKQIQGFVQNAETGDIKFTMTDKNDKLSAIDYIDTRHHSVKIGSVRKITNRWEELSAGMKIVANKTGISMFPKKDTNIIIGFLYDTGGPEPLVLCSNAATLWYSDVLENFDIIKMDDAAWKTKKHAPISPSKMRYQAGDILKGKNRFANNCGYLVYRPRDQRTVRAAHLGYYHMYEESYVFDRMFTRDVIFDSIPNPRLSVSQENKLGFVNAFPNFHGMYITTEKFFSPYLVANDTRSILNVPSDSE